MEVVKTEVRFRGQEGGSHTKTWQGACQEKKQQIQKPKTGMSNKLEASMTGV